MSRLLRPAPAAAPAAGTSGQRGMGRLTRCGTARMALGVAAAMVAGLAAAGCDGGAIAADTPKSNGQSFVSGSYSSTVYKAGDGPAAPNVSGATLTGQRLSLASYRGHIVVLNFWGSWCSDCRAEAPALGTLARQTYASGVRFIGVDIMDETAAALAYMQTFRIGYPSLFDPSDQIALAFRSTVPPADIPTTLVIGRTGQIAARIFGSVTYQELKTLLHQVSAERS